MKFSDLIAVSELQALCESFTAFTGAVTAVLDLDGNILVATGWQDVCTQFHRVHPATSQRCLESDTILAGQLSHGEKYTVYKCKNGLVDVAVPIVICGEHVGNFFTGQFFFEKPDLQHFLRQAEEFGFDQQAYLDAINKAPIFTEDNMRSMMDFFTRLAHLIGDMGMARANQEQANQDLRHSKTLLQTIIDTAPMRVFWKDLDLRYIGCNPAFAKDAGQSSPAEIIGKDDFQLSWSDKAKQFRADDRKVMESGQPKLYYDEEITTHDGLISWVRTSKIPLTDGSNAIIGVLGIYEDITASKQAEIDLRVAAIAMESQEGTIISDADGLILRVNQSFAAITGYLADEVVGQSVGLFKSPCNDDGFYGAIWDSVRLTGIWKGELFILRKNGQSFPAWLNITAVKGADGKVTHYVATFSDITQHKAAEDQIKLLAFYDPLTLPPNRRLLTDRLNQALAASGRSGREGALIFIDLDNFKTMNDSQGHGMGDRLLQEVGRRLNESFRDADTVARLGGDEFVVVLTDLNASPKEAAAQAEAIGQKILSLLGETHIIAGQEFRCTPSIGITLFGNPCGSFDELMKQADIAMYQAKAGGRNTLRFFDPQLQATIKNRAALESELIIAIQEDQLALFYQPQVDGIDRLIGAEALVRWIHPRRGLISPTEFIPLAEETGLILPLGKWVLETACRQIAAWAGHSETSDIMVAVNVSARQFTQANFVDWVLSVVERTEANPRRLKLELTESMLLDNVEDIIVKMSALKACGIGFALDDFGTGYSSLAYLKRLPLDQLKIDQSFTRDMLTDPNDAAIASTIVTLGHSLGLTVIAEGVETKGQQDFLSSAGCHSYQGFFFGRPTPAQDFSSLCRDRAKIKSVYVPIRE